MKAIVLCLALLVCSVRGNLWDNLLSRLETKHRIELPQTDQFEVAYKRLLSSYVVSVHFNQSVGIRTQLDMEIGGVFREPLFTLALNLANRTLEVVMHSRKICTIVQLPNTLEISYRNTTYPIEVNSLKAANLLVSLLTKFDHSEGNIFVYKLTGDLLSRRTQPRLLQ